MRESIKRKLYDWNEQKACKIECQLHEQSQSKLTHAPFIRIQKHGFASRLLARSVSLSLHFKKTINTKWEIFTTIILAILATRWFQVFNLSLSLFTFHLLVGRGLYSQSQLSVTLRGFIKCVYSTWKHEVLCAFIQPVEHFLLHVCIWCVSDG